MVKTKQLATVQLNETIKERYIEHASPMGPFILTSEEILSTDFMYNTLVINCPEPLKSIIVWRNGQKFEITHPLLGETPEESPQ